jgi:hypothetical protein
VCHQFPSTEKDHRSGLTWRIIQGKLWRDFMREKRRPTLEELREMPLDLWRLEILQTTVDAEAAGREDVQREGCDLLLTDPDITPEKVVALREKLQRAMDGVQVVEASVAI